MFSFKAGGMAFIQQGVGIVKMSLSNYLSLFRQITPTIIVAIFIILLIRKKLSIQIYFA